MKNRAGTTLEPFGRARQKSWHEHLHVIGIMCSKFQLDACKLWEEFETHHFTNRPTARLSSDSPLLIALVGDNSYIGQSRF